MSCKVSLGETKTVRSTKFFNCRILSGKGRAEEAQAKSETFVNNLIQSTDFNDVKITSLANVTIEFVKIMREKLAKKP